MSTSSTESYRTAWVWRRVMLGHLEAAESSLKEAVRLAMVSVEKVRAENALASTKEAIETCRADMEVARGCFEATSKEPID